mgnify:CR=1 FL=1
MISLTSINHRYVSHNTHDNSLNAIIPPKMEGMDHVGQYLCEIRVADYLFIVGAKPSPRRALKFKYDIAAHHY